MTEAETKTDEQKEKGPTFYAAPDDAAELLDAVREAHHTPRLNGLRIELVLTKQQPKQQGEEVETVYRKASPLTKDIFSIDVWIVLHEEFWQQHVDGKLPNDEVARALDHELCAMDWDGDGGTLRFKRMPGEFPEIIQRWGINGMTDLAEAIRGAQTALDLDG